ncbi:MAG: hypothetical protein L6V87_07780 [Ruminococcus sp.]|nr:MAG: hypothetical protein L6V87_07780 [Ruminococcus sp.]
MDMKNQSACNFLFGSDKKFTAEDVFGGEREFASDERLKKSFPVSFLTGNTEYLPRTWLRL